MVINHRAGKRFLYNRELATYQKLITAAYCDQIAGKNKQNGKSVHIECSQYKFYMCICNTRKVEATMKHLRIEIAKKRAEKIQVSVQ